MVQFVCKMSDLRAPDAGTQAEVIPERVVSHGELQIILAAPMQLRSSYEPICLRKAFDQYPLRIDIAFEHLLATQQPFFRGGTLLPRRGRRRRLREEASQARPRCHRGLGACRKATGGACRKLQAACRGPPSWGCGSRSRRRTDRPTTIVSDRRTESLMSVETGEPHELKKSLNPLRHQTNTPTVSCSFFLTLWVSSGDCGRSRNSLSRVL